MQWHVSIRGYTLNIIFQLLYLLTGHKSRPVTCPNAHNADQNVPNVAICQSIVQRWSDFGVSGEIQHNKSWVLNILSLIISAYFRKFPLHLRRGIPAPSSSGNSRSIFVGEFPLHLRRGIPAPSSLGSNKNIFVVDVASTTTTSSIRHVHHCYK